MPVSQITFAPMAVFVQIIFWSSVLALLHSYVLYPWFMRWQASGKKPNAIVYEKEASDLPVVGVLMSVFNEERVIVDKLESLKNLRYPASKLYIFIGSDASDDQTNTLVRRFETQFPTTHFQFYAFPNRRGKPAVINDLAEAALGLGVDLLLLTDASVMLEPDTLFHLAKHFKNPQIGVVDAHMRSKGLRVEGISQSEERYLSGEVRLKNWEGLAWGMMIGPFGGCYALRADLFERIPPRSLVDDFWLVFRVLEKGYLAINELDALCFEGATHRVADEYRRKKRIAAGSFQNLARFRRWVLPPASRLGFAFFSHKVLRWFGGFFLLAIFLSTAWLRTENQFFSSLFGLQLLGGLVLFFYPIVQKYGQLKPPPLLKNIAYFLAMNLALMAGFFKWLRGIQAGTWERTSRE